LPGSYSGHEKGGFMDDRYIPEKLKEYQKIDILYEVDNNALLWHTGICYKQTPAKQIKCAICGNNKFYVAESGTYWVGIKCIVCEYEICIADG
jgi:hypothetical protein